MQANAENSIFTKYQIFGFKKEELVGDWKSIVEKFYLPHPHIQIILGEIIYECVETSEEKFNYIEISAK